MRDAGAYRALMLDAYETEPEAFLSAADERAAMPLSWWVERLEGTAAAPSLVLGAFARMPPDRQGAASRRCGTARALLEALFVELGERRDTRLVQLAVTEGNAAAIALYRGLGFRECGTEPMAMRHGDGYLAKIHLWRRLRSS